MTNFTITGTYTKIVTSKEEFEISCLLSDLENHLISMSQIWSEDNKKITIEDIETWINLFIDKTVEDYMNQEIIDVDVDVDAIDIDFPLTSKLAFEFAHLQRTQIVNSCCKIYLAANYNYCPICGTKLNAL